MQYYYCPRCKFKMMAGKRRLCQTCGYKLPQQTAGNQENNAAAVTTTPLLSRLFQWHFGNPETASMEQTQEKPALG